MITKDQELRLTINHKDESKFSIYTLKLDT